MSEKQDNNKKEEVRYCEDCKADRKVVKVEELPDGRKITLECGHQAVNVVINENLYITENVEYVILKDPVAEVKRAVNEQDYFKTVTYAGSVLEYCGQMILLWNSKNTANPLTAEEVQDWKLKRVIDELLNRGIITATEATKLHSIRGLRNEFVHEDYSIKLTSKMAQKIDVHNEDIISYTARLKAIYDELAAKGKAVAAAD